MRGSLALLLAVAGCGGAPTSVPPPTIDAGTQDVLFDVVSTPLSSCPAAPPEVGSACNADGSLVCEYGDAESPSCDALFVCAAKQCSSDPPTWHRIGPTKTCPIAPPTGCASTYAQESTDDAGACTRCLYAEGTCDCGYCAAAPSNCPALANRPRLGTPCNTTIDGTPPNDTCPFQFDAVPLMLGCFTYACGDDGVWRVASCAFSLAPPPC